MIENLDDAFVFLHLDAGWLCLLWHDEVLVLHTSPAAVVEKHTTGLTPVPNYPGRDLAADSVRAGHSGHPGEYLTLRKIAI